MAAGNIALRHQLSVLKRSVKRPEAAQTGQNLLELLIPAVDWGAVCAADRSTWDGYEVASSRFVALLEMEAERLIGSIRRECLDHVVVFIEDIVLF